MGYTVLHLSKAKGTDTGMTGHIERKVNPKNAEESRTHLNKELIELPPTIKDRTQAIEHRISTAGITRKITPDQVRAIRIMLSASHEDMKRIEKQGRLNEWCQDNIDWLCDTFGKENVVAATLHMDEKTPHIHATVIPIVRGEPRKAKTRKTASKKKYRKKKDVVRLCADDVMSRQKLTEYQDTYANVMQVYGIERGIRGSEASHVTTQQYYKELYKESEKLKEKNALLLEQNRQEEEELFKVRSEVKKEKLKNSASLVASSAMDAFSGLLGSSKTKALEAHITELKKELWQKEEEIKDLSGGFKRKEEGYQKEIKSLKEDLKKISDYFPHISKVLPWVDYCQSIGLTPEQTKDIVNFRTVVYDGELYSKEHHSTFQAKGANLLLQTDSQKRFQLTINGISIHRWFKQQNEEWLRRMGFGPKRENSRQRKL